MGINYFRTVWWDASIINAWMDEDSFVCSAQKNTTGAPDATAGHYMPACIIQNVVDGTVYSNTGTTASPVWTLFDTGSGLTLPFAGTSASTTGVAFQVTDTALTSGSAFKGIAGVALTTGGIFLADLGVAVTGFGFRAVTTGVYTGTAGLLQVTANSSAVGTLGVLSGTGLTTGKGLQIVAAAATLTTGRYISMNDGALEVFGIGANGHIHTTQTTAPTAGTNATGISAVAVTAGSTDVCGTITTTGTPASGTVLTITFNKTYTTAPKFVTVEAANAAAGGVNTPPIVTQTATTFVLTWPAGGVYAATPSFTYFVVA